MGWKDAPVIDGWQSAPVEQSSGMQDFGVGFANSVRETGYGLRDAARVLGAGIIASPGMASLDQQQRQATDARRAAHPMPQSGAGFAGQVAGGVAATVPMMLLPGGQSVAGAALAGGLYGATQPVGTEDSRTKNAAVGAALGGGTSIGMKVAGKVVQPVKNVLSKAEQEAVDFLKSQGIDLSVAQQTGSKAMQSVERFLADNPITGPAMAAFRDKQGRQFTSAAARTIGENSDNVGPEVLSRARTRITGTMDEIASKYAPDIATIEPELAQMEASAARLGNYGQPIVNFVNDIRTAAQNGTLSGDTVRRFRTELGRLKRDQYVGGLANDLDEVLADGMQTAMQGTEDFARYLAARVQYRNLKSIESAATNDARATVSAGTLASRQAGSKFTRDSFKYGTGDQELANLARSGNSVIDKFPNSGTAARAGAQMLPAAGAAGLGYLNGERDPADLLKLAAMGYLGPKALTALMTNPAAANYLSKGIMLPPVAQQVGLLAQRALPPAAGLLTLQSSY